jgi:hypothetical protein
MMIESVTAFFIDWGYAGLFLSTFIAGSILPFSSEAVLVVLLRMGLDPVGLLASATLGNTLGGMTCYWIGHLGRREWIGRWLRIDERTLAKAARFLGGRGALMGFFAFLPYIGEAVALLLGLMRSNQWLTAGSMLVGKLVRYLAVLGAYEGIVRLF